MALGVVPDDYIGFVESFEGLRDFIRLPIEALTSVDVDCSYAVNLGGVSNEPVRLGVEQ